MEGPDLAQMVRDALAYAGGIEEAYLEVGNANGVIRLSGIAFCDAQRREAEEIAAKVPGVRRVVNEILLVKGS